MGIYALTSIAKKMGAGISMQIKRTSTLPPEQLVRKFFDSLSPQAGFNSYSQETRNAITDFVQIGDENATSFIKTLVDNNAAEKDILTLLKEPEQFKLYRAIKCQLNKLLQNVRFGNKEERNVFSQNLSLLGTKDSTSFLNMTESKGFREILEGNLSPEYVKDLRPNDRIGYNHFYDLFADIEKAADARLSKITGLDKESVMTLINSMDKEICKSPQVLEKLLVMLERHKNPDAVNKILKLFKEDLEIENTYLNERIKEIIQFTDDVEPDMLNKFFELYEGRPSPPVGLFGNDLKSLFSKENKIDKKLFEFLLKNKDKYNLFGISEINKFLNIEGANKNMLKKFMNALYKMDETSFSYCGSAVSENNFEYFKKLLEENKINKENYIKLLITSECEMFKDPANWSIADDIYKETFLPIFKATGEKLWPAIDFCGMRTSDPEAYNKLKNSGFIDLIISKKLKPNTYYTIRGHEFLPEVYSDLELLKNGGSVIKHFTSYDKILSKTSAGDVVSVNGKMFINNNGRLEAWNMTEEKFNELFPPVERFIGSQGHNDCFLYSAMESIYRNPKTRAQYYKLFEQKGDDILVTIPAYRNFNGTVTFNNGEIITVMDAGNGAKHYQMLEQAYARTALRKEATTPIGKDPITTDDYEYLYERLHGGQTKDAMRDLLNINPNHTRLKNNKKIAKGAHEIYFAKPNPSYAKELLDKYGNNPRLIANLGLDVGPCYHAVSVKSYNPETGIIEIIDPNTTGFYTKRNISEISPKIVKIWFTDI